MRKKQSKDLTSNGNYAILHLACGRGGTGRRVRLRGVWETVWVQVPSTAPTEKTILLSSFFHFLPKMMRRYRSVGAHVRCARATQMQALDCPSLAVDRTNRKLNRTRKMFRFFSFYRVLSFLFFDIMFYFVLLSSTFHGISRHFNS